MVVNQTSKVFHCIRTLALHQNDGTTDGNLLDLYARQKDEAAFETLVRRHGRMVLGVCRRILGNSHDAEDSFQASFLVLVRKAASIRPSRMVGNWLYGVAHRTALEARRSIAKRRAKEAQVAPRSETPDDPLARLRPLLDQELPRLPTKYRAVLVLCDLEGRTRKEAAQQLGLPEGTIASRLSRARTILAKRLTRHGLKLSGGVLAMALAQEAASASTPHSLVFATVKAATAFAAGPAAAAAVVSAPIAALTEGVLKAMLLNKLKITLVLFAMVGAVGTGLGGLSFRAAANDQATEQSGQLLVAQADEKQPKKVQPEQDKTTKEGRKAPDEKKPPDRTQAMQILDMVLKGFQAYKDSKAGREVKQDLVTKHLEKLQGTWRVVSSQVGDEKAAEDEVTRRKITVKGDLLIYENGNEQKEKQEGKIILDPQTKAFDWVITWPEKTTMLAIYELIGDDLRIGFGNDGLVRPRQFMIGKEDVVWLLVLKRDNPKKDVPKKEADSSADQERIIAAIKELGGHVLINRGTDGTSTIKVILSETNVQDKDLEQLKGLPDLQELYLFRTKVTGEGLKHLKGLTRLQKLDLSHCTELTDAGLTNLNELTNLQTLDVTNSGIRDEDLKNIKKLTDLRSLYIRFNPKITDAGLEELKDLTKLQTLDLDRTEITDAGLKHLKGLTKLRTLHLANEHLTDATLEHLKGFTDLRSLSLWGTQATDDGLVNLKGLTDLEELHLVGTRVTDAGLANLKELTKLRTLDLRLTKTTDGGVMSLKEALPKLKVIR